jgi:hypothetical protein
VAQAVAVLEGAVEAQQRQVGDGGLEVPQVAHALGEEADLDAADALGLVSDEAGSEPRRC